MSNKVTPGGWQEERNQWGGVRRFRMVGPIKEYEMICKIDGVDVPESEVEAFHQRRAAEREQRLAASSKMALQAQPKVCPFNGGCNHNCSREKCALYTGEGCTLAQIAPTGTGDTAGKSCPFSPYTCREDCSLYKNGCVLTAMKERI